MKRLVSFFAFFICICCIFGQARIKFIPSYIDLDTLRYEDTCVTCKAFYTNIGNAPLYVLSGKSFCPCVTFELNEEALAPGDTSFLLIKHVFRDTADFSHPVRVTYFYDEEENRSEMVTIYGYVK